MKGCTTDKNETRKAKAELGLSYQQKRTPQVKHVSQSRSSYIPHGISVNEQLHWDIEIHHDVDRNTNAVRDF